VVFHEPPGELQLSPTGAQKVLFGSLAGYVQVHLGSADEWDEALEFAWSAAAAGESEADEDLDPDEQYIRSYERYPETEEETAWVNAALETALANVP
jgi:hypothetical protein